MSARRVTVIIGLLGLLSASGCRALASYRHQGDDAGVADGAGIDGRPDTGAFDASARRPPGENWGKWFGDVCKSGWCWEHPLPQGGGLNAIWLASPSEAFAVGVRGLVLHFDGLRWRQMDTPSATDLRAIHGTAPDNLLAVGDQGTVLHFDGRAWRAQDSGSRLPLNDVWVFAGGEAIAVGNGGLVLRKGRTESWLRQTIGTTREPLRGIWGKSTGEAIVVGDGGTILSFDPKRGSAAWLRQSSGTNLPLRAVWGESPLGPVIVGGVDGRGAVVLTQRSDQSWQRQDVPSVASLTAVWGSAHDLVIVAPAGETLTYDAGSWVKIPVKASLRGVSGVSGGPLIAVGDGGAVYGLAEGWQRLLPASQTQENLYAVWAAGTEEAFAVGSHGVVMQRDHAGWRKKQHNATEAALRGVWGTSTTNVYFVGDAGTLIRFTGKGRYYAEASTDFTASLKAIGGRSESEIYTVGNNGAFFRWNGLSWSTPATLPTLEYDCVWGDDSGQIYAGGGGGGNAVLSFFDRKVWSSVKIDVSKRPPTQVTSVWGVEASGELYVAGSQKVYRVVKDTWTLLPAGGAVWALWGRSDLVYGVGASGSIARLDGQGMGRGPRVDAPPYRGRLWAVGGAGSRLRVWAVGNDGTILRRDAPH